MIKILSVFIISCVLINYTAALKVFTKSELAAYDGSDSDLPIYLAIKGVVYDVTKGSGFYGKGGSYNALAGKDCARAIAKYSVEAENLTDDLTGLTPSELEGLETMIKKVYKAKYTVVGHMDYYKGPTDEL